MGGGNKKKLSAYFSDLTFFFGFPMNTHKRYFFQITNIYIHVAHILL